MAIADVEVVAATDVTNPLCGPTGASEIFGPQKGASKEVVAELDAALLNFAHVVKRDIGRDILDIRGAGAAGGWEGVLPEILFSHLFSQLAGKPVVCSRKLAAVHCGTR